jgi:hypothetical protein
MNSSQCPLEGYVDQHREDQTPNRDSARNTAAGVSERIGMREVFEAMPFLAVFICVYPWLDAVRF